MYSTEIKIHTGILKLLLERGALTITEMLPFVKLSYRVTLDKLKQLKEFDLADGNVQSGTQNKWVITEKGKHLLNILAEEFVSRIEERQERELYWKLNQVDTFLNTLRGD